MSQEQSGYTPATTEPSTNQEKKNEIDSKYPLIYKIVAGLFTSAIPIFFDFVFRFIQ